MVEVASFVDQSVVQDFLSAQEYGSSYAWGKFHPGGVWKDGVSFPPVPFVLASILSGMGSFHYY